METTDERELALIAGVQLPGSTDESAAESMGELAALADTAGAEVVSSFVQRRTSYDPNTLIGRGKVDELAASVSDSGATLVVFDSELSSGQQDRLEKALGARVIDRTALILDIFAQHAHTAEGRTQVELAQLSYMLPRLRGRGIEMSRMAGGIGTRRGPGETQLEVDRRTLRRRIKKLQRDLADMEAVRSTQRKRRARAGLSQVSLVGYTNSGKSSLLNTLTDSEVLVEDRLFSTLDSTTRKLVLPDGRSAVLSDTVGFIRKLPHELVAAFRSTLEVVRDADLLLHVIDGSKGEETGERMAAVTAVLDELGAEEIPRIDVFNKTDLIEKTEASDIERRYPGGVLVSAKTGAGSERLLSKISEKLGPTRVVLLEMPSARGDLLASLYREGRVIEVVHEGETSSVTVELPVDRLDAFRQFIR